MGCFVGAAVERAAAMRGSLLGVWVVFAQCVFQLFEHQPKFVHFTKSSGVAPANPRELLPLPAVKAETIPNTTHRSFFEVVACFVS